MNDPTEVLLKKAEQALSDAIFNFEGARYEASLNRSYYTAFYCITAFLETKELYSKTHQGAHHKFHEAFVKPGLLPIEMSKSLSLLFKLRQTGDYDFEREVTGQEVQQALDSARAFLSATQDYFNRQT